MSYHARQPSGDAQSRAPTYHTNWAPPANDYYDPYTSASPSTQKLRRAPTEDSMTGLVQPYRDEPQRRPSEFSPAPAARRLDPAVAAPGGEKSLGASRFSPATPRFKSDFRTWRRDFHGDLWTKGRGINCCARFCCCTFLIAIFMLISILLTLAVYVRPPDITFNNVTLDTASGSAVLAQSSGLTINLKIDITVANPNFFSAGFQSIQAKALYPIKGQPDTAIGGGTSTNVVFKTETISTLSFPFAIVYTEAIDPSRVILTDILTKCGFMGSPKENLSINYQLTLKIKIIVFTISPQFTGNANFACPLTESEVAILVNGLDIPGITATL